MKSYFTQATYKVLRILAKPLIIKIFKPVYINTQAIPKGKPILFMPNHRMTIDPFVIAVAAPVSIHWVALKRFFTGEDSIFNNSKNLILRMITKYGFRMIGAVPVNRGGDISEAQNLLEKYLALGQNVGIFPEGTTNKSPEKQALLAPKPGGAYFARKYDAYIQPIAITWINDNPQYKVVVNFSSPFKAGKMNSKAVMQEWSRRVRLGLEENEKWIKKNQKDTLTK